MSKTLMECKTLEETRHRLAELSIQIGEELKPTSLSRYLNRGDRLRAVSSASGVCLEEVLSLARIMLDDYYHSMSREFGEMLRVEQGNRVRREAKTA